MAKSSHMHRFFQVSLGEVEQTKFRCHDCGAMIVVHRDGKVDKIKPQVCAQIMECGHPCVSMKGHDLYAPTNRQHECGVSACFDAIPRCEHGLTAGQYSYHLLSETPCNDFRKVR